MKNKFAFTLAEVLITLVIIGVVAALTIPTAISKYRKTTVETRLKNSYSTLVNAVKMSTIANGDISGWDYGIESWEEFLNKYLFPYVRNSKMKCYVFDSGQHCDITISNGSIWIIEKEPKNPVEGQKVWTTVVIDVNGNAKPNIPGHDRFAFHIFNKVGSYNHGDGDLAWGVPSQGVYYDGYGMNQNYLKTNQYRGCNNSCLYSWNAKRHCMFYCTALIAQNGWKIPDDYPINF